MKAEVKLPDEKKDGKKVHLDFSKAAEDSSPFQKATSQQKRLKLFLWGDSGVGKTTLSLQFPSPAVIDLEGGTDLYGDSFKFDVLRVNTPDEIMAAVDWLLTSKHSYKTLVIDPVTIYWDALQKKWSDIFLKRNKGSKGHKFEFYDLQPRDWMTVKAEFKEFIRKLIALEMNVIVTAREKTKYADNAFMKAVGETFDGEKSLPYLFDTIVRMKVDPKGRHVGVSIKDRSNKLPREEFDCSYATFEKLFGKKSLNQEAQPVLKASEAQKTKLKQYIEQFKMTPAQLTKRLAAYGAEGLDDLTEKDAAVIISKLEAAIKSQTGKEKRHAQG